MPIEFIRDVLLSKLQDKSLARLILRLSVDDIRVKQMPAFKKAYKKLSSAYQSMVNETIKTIIKSPEVGEAKRGDLSGVYVYRFKIYH